LLPAKWRGEKIGVSCRDDILGGGAGAVTTITVGHSVDQIASQAPQISILALKVKVNRGDSQAAMNPCRFIVVTTFVVLALTRLALPTITVAIIAANAMTTLLVFNVPLFCVIAPLLLIGMASVFEIGAEVLRMF
jgi:hypothetical protein